VLARVDFKTALTYVVAWGLTIQGAQKGLIVFQILCHTYLSVLSCTALSGLHVSRALKFIFALGPEMS
jgi:hypothetical protein